jgi:hypothetical protein
MSGGSLNYAYAKLEMIVDEIEERDLAPLKPKLTPLQREFAEHLRLVVKALHDLEWVWSADYGEGDEEPAILAVLGRMGEP